MGLTDRYRHLLKALRPPGKACPSDAESNWHKLLDGLAVEPGRVHDRVDDLLAEMDPATATELLSEWETTWGLPDACTGQLDTLGERRVALLSRIRSVGSQHPSFYIELAARLGYVITITENVGGDPTVWQVNAPDTTVRWARAGAARAGDAIRTWGNESLACAIEGVNPAHLTVIIAYGGS